MSYKERELTVSFTLANGTFDGGIGNTLTVKGFKCEAAISAFGGATGTMMELSLWGLSLENMAKLTTNAQKISPPSKMLSSFMLATLVFFPGQ